MSPTLASPGWNPGALFIQRPVATSLLALALILAGLLAFFKLPVAPLPQVDFPTIAVSARLPGASPETMAATVATPLERSLGAIAGVTEITSTSTQGSTRITLQFELERNIDSAARSVQAAINAARPQLPSGMPDNPSYRKVNPAEAPMMIFALTSKTLSRGQIYDAASTLLAQRMAQIEGVGEVHVGGSSLPAVRVELIPELLERHGISVDRVRAVIEASNSLQAKGAVQQQGHFWQIAANDQSVQAADYAPLLLAWRNNAAVRLQDVARVENGEQDVRNAGLANGQAAVTLFVNREPGANIIATVARVKALLPQLTRLMPTDVEVQLVMERTSTIRASLEAVERSLLLACLLVVMSVLLFLQNWRAALITGVAVPVSLITTFAMMYLFGYSLNNLSLMALTIATGFVVDDAVVVLENISRHREAGRSPLAAALQGVREVGFTVLAISVSLTAVFIPILFMGGIIGRLFREFAITLSTAIAVSLLVSLSLTPMLCAHGLGPLASAEAARPGAWQRFGQRLRRLQEMLLHAYTRSLAWVLQRRGLAALFLLLTIAANIGLYIHIPKGFFPQQDVGRLMGSLQADQSISFTAMRSKMEYFAAEIAKDPAVASVIAFTGGGQQNGARLFIGLKPRDERDASASDIISRLRKRLGHEPGARLMLMAQQDIRMGGRAANAQYQYTLQSDDLASLRLWAPRVTAELAKLNELRDVDSDQEDRGAQLDIIVDREAAARLGITQRQIDVTLAQLFGQQPVSTVYHPLNQYRVIMEAAPEYWRDPQVLDQLRLSVTQDDGSSKLVPLAAFARFGASTMSLSVNHQGQFAALTSAFNLAPGVSLAQATLAIDQAMARLQLPRQIQARFQGTARAFQDSMDSQPWLILAAIVAVYIVLGMLYESLLHPLTILSTLPSAGVGALLALLAFDTEFTFIALIGVILLVGIVMKNAILMIDFALAAERQQGLDSVQAIQEACRLRFRPIMMTTLAALLGALPLALSSGEGAELRQPLGLAIVGGLLLSQLLTLYTTPVVYVWITRLQQRLTQVGRDRQAFQT